MKNTSFCDIDLKLKKFEPILPLATAHTQTLIGHLIPSVTKKIKYKEFILKLKDGDKLLLQYFDSKSDLTLSLFHGLGGDSSADYIRRSADIAMRNGWNIVLVNHRRASTKAEAKKTYHSGRADDASAVIEWSRNKFKGSKQIAVGFSMSGSILLNLVCGRGGKSLPDYAVVVNSPLDLHKAAIKLSEGFNRVYDYRFYLILKKIISRDSHLRLPVLGRTFDIDEAYTSKINGFKNAVDYYKRCSTYKILNKMKIKTFVLSSHDDPFIDIEDYVTANWNENAHLTLIKQGGHMGYFQRLKSTAYGHRWLDHYIETVFNQISKLSSR